MYLSFSGCAGTARKTESEVNNKWAMENETEKRRTGVIARLAGHRETLVLVGYRIDTRRLPL